MEEMKMRNLSTAGIIRDVYKMMLNTGPSLVLSDVLDGLNHGPIQD
jgi:hypothetical protein